MPFPRFAVTIHRGTPAGQVVADLTRHATACRWSYNPHGCRELEVTAPRRFIEAMRLYAMTGQLWAVVTQGATRVWAGRVSAPELWAGAGGSGVTIRALGHWATLDDIRYTALWSETRYGLWEQISEADVSTRTPSRFTFDTNNRLNIEPKKGTVYAANNVGELIYRSPYGNAQRIARIEFDYAFLGSSSLTARLVSSDEAFASGAIEWTVTGNGALQTGTVSRTLPTPRLWAMFNLLAAAHTYAGENGAEYLRITALRIKAVAASTITADLIAADLVTSVNAANAGAVTGSVLTSPALDLNDVVYEDAAPTEILNQLGVWGDGAGTIYQPWADVHGYLHFRAQGTNARAWLIDVADLRVASERDDLANSVYAVYADARGRVLRTAAATHAASIGLAGYTRQAAVEVRTTSATWAGKVRDQALADRATLRPSGRYRITRVRTAQGAPADPSSVRPGDTLTVRSLPLMAAAGSEVDRARTFRLSEVIVDPIAGALTVTPETSMPRLDVLLAQASV